MKENGLIRKIRLISKFMTSQFFLKNHTQNLVEKLFPDLFPDLWINILKFYIFYLNCFPSWGLSKLIEAKLQTISFYLIQSFLKKQKDVSNKSFVVIFYYMTKFQCLVAFTSRDIAQYVYFNCLLTRLWRQKLLN